MIPATFGVVGGQLLHVARRAFKWHGLRVNEQSFPVTVLVTRPDGSSEQVRVGTAVRSGDGFRLSLGELSIGASPVPSYTPPQRAAPASWGGGGGGGDGLVFPPYGRSKGAPIAGASMQDLEFYISGSRRTLNDPAKARWHDKERALLAAMEAEVARQTGRTGQDASGGHGFEAYDGPPDHTDDDIPF